MIRMFRRFLLLSVIAAALVCAALAFVNKVEKPIAGDPLPAVSEGVSILTWNLQWFPGNSQKTTDASEQSHVEAVATNLKGANADIVCLQEVKGAEAVDRLLELLPEYRVQSVSNFRGVQEIAIISKLDAVTVFAEEFKKAEATPPRGFVYAAYNFDGHYLLVYSIHLKSNYGGVQENIPKREESARQLLAHVADVKKLHREDGAKSVSIVLSGDFNTSLISDQFAEEKTGQIILDGGFEWGFRGMSAEETVTWLTDGRYPDVTFDHFFVQADEGAVAGRSTALPTERSVSDHRPVVMRFVLPVK